MTQEEHLNRIVAKCRKLLAGEEGQETDQWLEQCKAGWRSTIAAIDMLQNDYESLNDAGNKDGMRVIQWRMDDIIAAWPKELL